jgi:uncharacterized protein (DUF2147 family)
MMNLKTMKQLSGLALLMVSTSYAQMTPVGVWHSIDDKTAEAKAEIQIVEKDAVLTGRVTKSLRTDAAAKKICDECQDDRKGKEIIGMEIIRAVKIEQANEFTWGNGGKILDPENGKEYTVKMMPKEGGKKLLVRGYIGPFYRTQTWLRVQQ